MAENGSEEKAMVEMSQDLSISRGMTPEVTVDFKKCVDLFVYDELGNKIRFGNIFKKQKTIIVFVRHLLDFVCKDYVEDMAVIPLEYLQEADVRLVVIGPSPYKYIKSFKKATGYMYTLYCDPDRTLYKALGCNSTMDYGKLKESKHVKSGVVMGMLNSVWRATQEKAKVDHEELAQQGGSFILGPGEEVHYAHIDHYSTDHTPLNDLLTLAGVQNVSFPKDPRILDL